MPLVEVTAPTAEPLSVAEVKTAAHITHTSEDTFIGERIAAARFRYEQDTRRQLMRATYDWFIPCFSSRWNRRGAVIFSERSFEVPITPLDSITTIKYFDTAGAQQTLATSVYDVKTSSDPGRIYNKPNQEWPDLEDDRIEDAVEIRIVCGSADAASVPDLDKQAVMLLTLHWIEHREMVVLDDRIRSVTVPMGYEEIVQGRKIILTG